MERESDSVMTIEDLSTYLNFPNSTLYKLAQEGKLSGQKVSTCDTLSHCQPMTYIDIPGLPELPYLLLRPTDRRRRCVY